MLRAMASGMRQQAIAQVGMSKQQSEEILSAAEALEAAATAVEFQEAVAEFATPDMMPKLSVDNMDGLEIMCAESEGLGVTLVEAVPPAEAFPEEPGLTLAHRRLLALGTIAIKLSAVAELLSKHVTAEGQKLDGDSAAAQ